MNTIVFVLTVLAYNGHFNYIVIPTLEFTTLKKCEDAIDTFAKDAKGRAGPVNMRCVRIEK